MGYLSLVAVLLLLFAGGTNAARLYPASRQSKNEASLTIQGLLQGLTGTDESGSKFTYFAEHDLEAGPSTGFYGFSVTMDVYGFSLSPEQYTSAAVQFFQFFNAGDGAVSSMNSIHIGWDVSPSLYGDSRTHVSSIWTTDGFQKTGCVNAKCGFQPESGAAIALGDVIEPVSELNGVKQNITIKVYKDMASGDWLVHYGLNQADPALIGRFPKSLFTGGLADRATSIHFAGVTVSNGRDLAPMGSGYLPTDPKVAASFSNIQIIDQNGQASLITQNLPSYLTQNTYAVTPVVNGQFFYGGPLQPTA